MMKSTLFGPAAGVAVIAVSLLLGSTAPGGGFGELHSKKPLPAIDRVEEIRTYGAPLANFSDRELSARADLYSPELTGQPGVFELHSPELEAKLVPDRVVPLAKVRSLGWSQKKREAFGHDLENISLTSHWANSWKGISGPAELRTSANQGSFSWSDSCVAFSYSRLIAQTPGCQGLPKDFDGPGYARSYRLIAERYDVPLSFEDRAALRYFSQH